MKILRTAFLAVGLLAAATATACAPPAQPSSAGLSCDGSTLPLSASPGLGLTSRPTSVTLDGPGGASECEDRTGTGITGVRVVDLQLDFAALGCFNAPGTSTVGPGTLEWSDGSRSAVIVAASLDGVLDGALGITVVSGPFGGYSGETRFTLTFREGTCLDGSAVRMDATYLPLELRGS